jgi:uroporphyrinogen III methyltransferase/synthase
VLWARASRGRDVLPQELSAAKATLEQIVVYQNRDVEQFPQTVAQQLEQGQLDWIALSSPSIARNLARLLPDKAKIHLGHQTKLASISPVTSAAAREGGLPITVEATEYTWNGLFRAMMAYGIE